MNNNKLIAEFMGLYDEISLDSIAGNIHSWSDAPFFYITEDSKEKVMEGITEYSKYHTSWDWLMPVVQKIEDIECKETSTDSVGYHLYDIEIRQNVTTIHGTNIEETVGDKLFNTYSAVVEFIKQYNDEQ